jgi:DNA mismatch repair protein MutL
MRGGDPAAVLRELLDDWLEAGASRAVESRLENMLATIACHCAVRAGDRLTPHEVEALLRSMDEVDFRAHCPHGRPVLLRLSLDELARRFGR